MLTRVRRRLEMGQRALTFSRANPDPDAGFVTAVGRLEQGVATLESLATDQRVAIIAERSANQERRLVRDHIQRVLLRHVGAVAVSAAREVPSLLKHVRVRVDNNSYASFRTSAGAMADAAQAQQEILVRHGLSPAVLTGLATSLAAYDDAHERSRASRLAHITAYQGMVVAVEDMVQAVRILDAFNRDRYRDDPKLLNAWTATINIFGPIERVAEEIVGTPEHAAPGTPPAGAPSGDQVKPAA